MGKNFDTTKFIENARDRLRTGKTVICCSAFGVFSIVKKIVIHHATNKVGVETAAGFCDLKNVGEFYIFDTPKDALQFLNERNN